MALIEWGPSLRVGVAEIDNQHKKLVELVNKLNDAMAAGHGRDVLGPTLNELVQYTVYHFETEERLMRNCGYEHAPAHKAEHAKLIKDVGDFKQRYESGNTRISIEIMRFLRDWLGRHILGSDKKLAEVLNGAAVH